MTKPPPYALPSIAGVYTGITVDVPLAMITGMPEMVDMTTETAVGDADAIGIDVIGRESAALYVVDTNEDPDFVLAELDDLGRDGNGSTVISSCDMVVTDDDPLRRDTGCMYCATDVDA